MERVFDKGRLRLKRKCSLEERWRGREREKECVSVDGQRIGKKCECRKGKEAQVRKCACVL